MSGKTHAAFLSLAIIAVLIFSAVGPTIAYADGESPDTPVTETAPATDKGDGEPTDGVPEGSEEATVEPTEESAEATSTPEETTAEATAEPVESTPEGEATEAASTEGTTEEAAPAAEE